MTDRRNFLAGVASSGWTALAGLLTVPWLISFLGIEAYGMIGVYLTLQNVFVLLDLGFSPAVSREVARAEVAGTMAAARALVHSLSVLFLISGAVAALGLGALSPWLAANWLNTQGLPPDEVAFALALSAVAIGARWPATLYVGVLNGARRVDLASAVTAISTTLATIGAVAVLAVVEPSLRVFFLWQALVGALHSVLMRAAAVRTIGLQSDAKFGWDPIRSVWRFSAGMAGVAATGILFSQIDKLVLMRTTTLDQVGYYTIATSLTAILYRLVTPAFNVVYPRLSATFEAGSRDDLVTQYLTSTRRFLTVIFPAAMFLIVAARPLLSIWLQDPHMVANVATLVNWLTVGTAIHSIMYFPYALQIACGRTRIPLAINLILSVVFLPAVFLLSSARGAEGAAISWVLLQTLYLCLGTVLTERHVLPGAAKSWIVASVTPPLAISLAFGFAAAAFSRLIPSDLLALSVAATFALAALGLGGVLLPEGRTMSRRAWRRLFRGGV